MRKSNKYIPVMLNSARSKKSGGWKTAFLILLVIVGLVVSVVLISNQRQPFSTITPTTTPLMTVPPAGTEQPEDTPVHSSSDLPEGETGPLPDDGAESTPEAGAKNPVETLFSAYQQAYTAAEPGFLAVAEAHSLRALSFKLALAQSHGTVTDICAYFTDLSAGTTPGEWGNNSATIRASGGNYELAASFNTGARIEGTISSSMTRMTCTVFGTDGETPIRTIELVKGSDGYYAKVWESAGVYANTRYYTGPNGLHCAIDSKESPSVFDAVPVNWAAFSEGSAESVRCTQGGAIVTINGEETICNLDNR